MINALLIDGFNLIRRIYEAGYGRSSATKKGADAQDSASTRTDRDLIEHVVSSASASVKRALTKHDPTHACCVLDSHDKTWRHLLYPQYKADRKETPSPLLDNLNKFEAAFSLLGVKCLTLESYEADDVIATLARGIAAGKGKSIILSTDKSYLQLLGEGIRIFDHFNDRELTRAYVIDKFGVEVDQLIDYWSLAGDRGNFIKGVNGVGDKSAARLLREHGSLDAILRSQSGDKKLVAIQEDKAVALRCKLLVTLNTEVELATNLKDLRYIPSEHKE